MFTGERLANLLPHYLAGADAMQPLGVAPAGRPVRIAAAAGACRRGRSPARRLLAPGRQGARRRCHGAAADLAGGVRMSGNWPGGCRRPGARCSRGGDLPADSPTERSRSSTSTSSSSAPACPASAPRCHLQERCPAKTLRDPRGARRASAAPGTCSATRASAPTPTCTRSATVPARGRTRRRSPTAPSILRYVRETAREHGIDRQIRFRHRVVARRWSTRRRALDGRGRAGRRAARPCGCTCGFLLLLQRLLPLRRGLHARRSRASRALPRPRRAPAALAGGPRLRRQARRRDRQRRHRGHARAGAGRERRARDDAAALADLRRVAARRRPGRRLAARALPARLAYALMRWKNVLLAHAASTSWRARRPD